MPSPRGQRFTIYDALDNAGYFTANPANSYSRDTDGNNLYLGPVEYPKMLYSPKGEEQITRAGEPEQDKINGGFVLLNERREMIHRIVASQEEEEEAVAEGWHTHPALAIRSRVEAFIAQNEQISSGEKAKLLKAIPQISSEERVRSLEKELERMTALLARETDKQGQDEPPLKPKQVALG